MADAGGGEAAVKQGGGEQAAFRKLRADVCYVQRRTSNGGGNGNPLHME